ncbi:DNA topoisomerase-1 [Hoeflea marina]|uniref:DNA topoisomerase-1 n=1 Tax=Hoeflea marina TaxID=274592 RepID=A0A317PN48_9HYPH|nr:DNA topoisomerase IB [Hoeflea marina]PWW01478.1 DNA topoisomerase-1 [Hoeflea marina]
MQAELKYVSDTEPGIRRLRRGRGHCFVLPDGQLLKDERLRSRIRALGIPPAYQEVWICLDENGHIQATGVDARGRKQYRYHPEWEAARSRHKFAQLPGFGAALPRIRRQIRRDLETELPAENAILAAMLALIDEAHIRVGSKIYVKQNRTYGAATLLKRHVDLGEAGSIRVRFPAKGGRRDEYLVESRLLHDALDGIADLDGRELFSWRGEDGQKHEIDSGRLNRYLGRISGGDFTAKTFRTWAGSLAAFRQARQAAGQERRPTIKEMCEAAARDLHNTPAICRSSYVHPAVLDLAEDVSPLTSLPAQPGRRRGLKAEEGRFLAFLDGGPRSPRPESRRGDDARD